MIAKVFLFKIMFYISQTCVCVCVCVCVCACVCVYYSSFLGSLKWQNKKRQIQTSDREFIIIANANDCWMTILFTTCITFPLKASCILLWPEASHRLRTLSLSSLTFWWTCINASPVSLSLDIEDLSHVLSLRIAENDRSHSHVVTGSVRKIFSIHWMLGKKDICVVFRVSNADAGSTPSSEWNLCLQHSISCSSMFG